MFAMGLRGQILMFCICIYSDQNLTFEEGVSGIYVMLQREQDKFRQFLKIVTVNSSNM